MLLCLAHRRFEFVLNLRGYMRACQYTAFNVLSFVKWKHNEKESPEDCNAVVVLLVIIVAVSIKHTHTHTKKKQTETLCQMCARGLDSSSVTLASFYMRKTKKKKACCASFEALLATLRRYHELLSGGIFISSIIHFLFYGFSLCPFFSLLMKQFFFLSVYSGYSCAGADRVVCVEELFCTEVSGTCTR